MTLALSGLDGKVAVVTGAGRMSGIGRAIALELARGGCDIVVTGRGRAPEDYPSEERAAGWRDIESVADEIRALGRTALPVVSDVADPAAVQLLSMLYSHLFLILEFWMSRENSTGVSLNSWSASWPVGSM